MYEPVYTKFIMYIQINTFLLWAQARVTDCGSCFRPVVIMNDAAKHLIEAALTGKREHIYRAATLSIETSPDALRSQRQRAFPLSRLLSASSRKTILRLIFDRPISRMTVSEDGTVRLLAFLAVSPYIVIIVSKVLGDYGNRHRKSV
jgi:hypothetical protein